MTTLTHPAAPRRWQQWGEHSARLSWLILVLAIVFGLVAGTITATTGLGDERGSWPSPDYRPPLMFVIANGLYVLAILLSVPDLIVALATLGSQGWRLSLRHLLHGLAPVLVYVGFFEGSHHVGCTGVEWLCQDGTFTGQVHLLHHTIVGALPLIVFVTAGLSLLKPRLSAHPR